MSRFDQLITDTALHTGQGALQNQFLVAMPQLQDPNFVRTVTYVWKHNQDGALGIIINRPSRMRVSELLAELHLSAGTSGLQRDLGETRVLAGGPVEKHKGFILHSAGTEWEYTLPITEDISLTMSRDILESIAAGNGPRDFLVALGCAGWEAGQLEQEVGENIWLTVPAAPDLVFSRDYDNKASAVAGLLGVSLSQLSTLTGHS